MSEVILKVEHISKQYRLGLVGTGTLSHDLKRWFYKLRGKEDPYLKIGDTNDRSKAAKSDYVWAIKDINFEVKRGEVLGIIGKNGAGKSTLLKILSRVTSPTTGQIKTKGRIASLLEVGTGFHPELTGKENIYLNGAILGMTKAEIKAKEQEIVEFSGCQRYIDTPVKRYSSGMRVRLAFAVAAFLEPDILVVDEVLAVGDAEFQKKAIGKMQDISKGEGRTVLFVSHNMAAVKSLCTRAIVLEHGNIAFSGSVEKSIDFYLLSNTNTAVKNLSLIEDRTGTGIVRFQSFYCENDQGNCIEEVSSGEDVFLCFRVEAIDINEQNSKIDIGFSFHSQLDERVTVLYSSYQNKFFTVNENGTYIIRCRLNNIRFSTGFYNIKARITYNNIEADFPKGYIGGLDVIKGDYYKTGNLGYDDNTKLLINGDWSIVDYKE